jgi:hypothetical protein
MEQVLSIDLSTEPAHVVLSSIDQNKVEIIQYRALSFGKELLISSLLDRSISAPKTDMNGGEMLPDAPSNQDQAIIEITDIDSSSLTQLAQVLEEFPRTWTNSVVIVPMLEYLSLNVSLPFSDTKNINKILDLEVQDIVPFEVDEFIVEGHSVCALNANLFDVHVSLAPKKFIRNILALCRTSGLEPSIITTPCGSMAALPLVAPDYFQGNYALISVANQATYLTVALEGVIRCDKVIPLSSESASDIAAVIGQLKLSIMMLENKYAKPFAKVYVHASPRIIAELQQKLGRTIEVIELEEFVSSTLPISSKKAGAQAALAAIFVSGEKPAAPLTNFRVREFSFRPNWGALLQSLLSIRYYFLGLIGLILFTLFGTYQLKQLQISRIQNAVREQIRSTVPNLKGGEGNEIPAFLGELASLSKELESLGSSHEISPTNILVELTKDLAEQKDVTVNEIDIRPDRVILDISVPDYAAADRVERILKRKKDLYRRIRKDASSYASASGGRNFNFELKLVD